ncbi:sulfur carrier protein ThiS [Kineococcus aurantiacus]|uniref:Sulfur carrier protein n=1 Tax=Kineococcus aurantiacus TaxID=37633 RepID=A0A7Y9J238_9ACTN|nr:sulfur carrier protein ThiS [Kineococcus aurantiacus]NYD23648.1 sulfur carrier protein [Kineococcus aurantiacus]
MEIVLNGEVFACAAGDTVADVVASVGSCPPDGRGVAVAVGDEVVPRGRWAATHLRAGDRVELLGAVAGG